MARSSQDTTAHRLVAAYEARVALGGSGDLAAEAARLREAFQKRTGVFRPEDPWFEARSRAFWDDAVTSGFGADAERGELDRRLSSSFSGAHRGLFLVARAEAEETEGADARLVDVWAGAELLVHYLDEAQATDLDNAEGLVDARVIAAGDAGPLHVLPGAFFHAADATEPASRVLAAARGRGMSTTDALDALLRMELVLRASSRVKASFAYRVESLPRA